MKPLAWVDDEEVGGTDEPRDESEDEELEGRDTDDPEDPRALKLI